MGGCFGIDRRSDTSSFNSCVRKNHPLYREVINWRSDTPLSERELLSKRDEFWDTAPAFDGRREIWDALRAAANAFENEDFDLAQAILDGASITVPNGYLTESYDELGTRYQVPIYCLFKPVNLSVATTTTMAVSEGTTDSIENEIDTVANATVATFKVPSKTNGSKTHIKLRLSHTNRDIKLTIFSNDSILTCKQKLQNVEGIEVPKQRWFFGGKLLMDRMQIGSLKIPHNYIVQVVVDSFAEKKPLLQPLSVQASVTNAPNVPNTNTATIIIETADTAIAAS